MGSTPYKRVHATGGFGLGLRDTASDTPHKIFFVFFERFMIMGFSDLCFASVFGVLSAWLWVAIVTL